MDFKEDVFSDLDDHYQDSVTFSANNKSILIKLILQVYTKLRFHEVSKKHSEIEGDTVIRKQFSKLILFQNQLEHYDV